MSYKYRLFIALLIVTLMVITAYFTDIQPRLTRISLLKEHQHKTQTELIALAKWLPVSALEHDEQALTHFNQVDHVANLFALARAQGVMIEALSQSNLPGVGMTAHVVMQAGFAQIAAFIFALDQQIYPITITDFSFTNTKQQTLLASLQLILFNQREPLTTHSPAVLLHDPFCHAATISEAMHVNVATKLQATPLNVLKMIGYIAAQERSYAFILLPDNEAVAVSLGMQVGSEKGVVTAINADHLIITTPDKKHWLFSLHT